MDTACFRDALKDYKRDFAGTWWLGVKYKWEAVKCFQDNWDPSAADFEQMLARSLAKTSDLLSYNSHYPAQMIKRFAHNAPDEVRAMFAGLFGEERDILERIHSFKEKSEELFSRYGKEKEHPAQDENTITTYLWLRYPDKYFVYRFSSAKSAAGELKCSCSFKEGLFDSNIRSYLGMYDEIRKALLRDDELIGLLKSRLDSSCHPDPGLYTLTADFCYWLDCGLRAWLPEKYSPGISAGQWADLLQNKNIFTPDALAIMKRMKDSGGEATCTQLSQKYGETVNFYNSGSSSLAQRVQKETGCPVAKRENKTPRWWAILYQGRDARKEETGSFVWKLRAELSQALDKADLSDVPLRVPPLLVIWKISHGTKATGISDENKRIFEKRHVVVVQQDTAAKGQSGISQGRNFTDVMKKGDFFYLCYGNSIRLLGEITSEKSAPNPEIQNGWREREYKVLAQSKDTAPYTAAKKWWTPNENSTCIQIPREDQALFGELVLKPYFNMTAQELLGSEQQQEPGYWWLNANPKLWSFSDIAKGETKAYTLFNESGNKRRIFQNFLDARAGDNILCYESNPVKQIVALGKVSEAQDGKDIYIEKTEGLPVPIDYSVLKSCPELGQMEYFSNPHGSLFKLTKAEYDFLIEMIREENPAASEIAADKYGKADFLREVYMDENRYDMLTAVLEKKKNIILQGPPGVGKTFAAKRLAYAVMGEKDESRVEFVQFHQNYSYEDFVMGYKPDEDGFQMKNGIFYTFCQQAKNQPGKKFFFIIDEINRGNLSKIFGELLMLIESGHRGEKARLAYRDELFSVPENLYLIGTMNTADRSLAIIDYALRRRFSFIEMTPAFDSEGFKRCQRGFGSEKLNKLIGKIEELNGEIAKDPSLGTGFCIGHSYFCDLKPEDLEAQLKAVMEFDIIPMLEEYWFDENDKVKKWENELHRIFQDNG